MNSIYTIAISGVYLDGSLPSYAEECRGIIASAYSMETGKGKVVSETVGFHIVSGRPSSFSF